MSWIRYNRENKAGSTPSEDKLVWIFEDSRVGLGFFDGFTFRMWWGTDDCDVTHWAPIEYPGGPSD